MPQLAITPIAGQSVQSSQNDRIEQADSEQELFTSITRGGPPNYARRTRKAGKTKKAILWFATIAGSILLLMVGYLLVAAVGSGGLVVSSQDRETSARPVRRSLDRARNASKQDFYQQTMKLAQDSFEGWRGGEGPWVVKNAEKNRYILTAGKLKSILGMPDSILKHETLEQVWIYRFPDGAVLVTVASGLGYDRSYDFSKDDTLVGLNPENVELH